MSHPRDWQRIDDVLTPEGIARLQVGQVLMFRYEGSRNDMKIMKIDKDEVWAKQITTRDPNEVLVDGVRLTDAAEKETR